MRIKHLHACPRLGSSLLDPRRAAPYASGVRRWPGHEFRRAKPCAGVVISMRPRGNCFSGESRTRQVAQAGGWAFVATSGSQADLLVLLVLFGILLFLNRFVCFVWFFFVLFCFVGFVGFVVFVGCFVCVCVFLLRFCCFCWFC